MGISVRTDRRASRGAAGPPGAGAAAGPPLSPPAAPPAPAAAWASGPVSGARPWAPGASGEAQGALNFVSSPAARRASPSPSPPASRPQRAPARPPARPTGHYSHGDAFAPRRAAGELSDAHRQRRGAARSAQTRSGGAAGRSCGRPPTGEQGALPTEGPRRPAPPVRARAAVPSASLRGVRRGRDSARFRPVPEPAAARRRQGRAGTEPLACRLRRRPSAPRPREPGTRESAGSWERS